MSVLGFEYGTTGETGLETPVGPQSGQSGHSQNNDFQLGPTGPTGENMARLWRATELEPARQPEWLATKRIPKAAVSRDCCTIR